MRKLLVLGVALVGVACNKMYGPEAGRPAVVFGDGVAYGVGASHQRFNLASCLGKRTGQYFENMGQVGETPEQALKRLPELLAKQPRLVVVSLATNAVPVSATGIAHGVESAKPTAIVTGTATATASASANQVVEILHRLHFEGIPTYFIETEPSAHVKAMRSYFPRVKFVAAAQNQAAPGDAVYRELCDNVIEKFKESARRSF